MTYADEDRPGEAIASMFRFLASQPHPYAACGIIVPRLSTLGTTEQMVRAVLAAYRELGVTVYAAETGLILKWAHPAQTLLTPDTPAMLELGS